MRLLLLFLLPTLLSAQASLSLLSYDLDDGLSQSQVWCMVQDRKGYLWCGTQGGGLNRFDGLKFEHFSTAEGLPSAYIYALFEDKSGRLWAGTNRGAAWFDGQKFIPFGNNQVQINVFCEKNNHKLLAGTPEGLFEIDPSQQSMSPIGGLKTGYISSLYLNNSGTWIGTTKGLQINGYTAGEPGRFVTAICPDQAGTVWAGSTEGILWQFDASGKNMLRRFDQLGKIVCLHAAADGALWIGTSNNGVTILHPSDSTQTTINESSGLPHPYVRQILSDRTGQIWMATSGGGLVRKLNQPFRHLTTANGLIGNRIYALAEGPDTSLWWSAAQNGLQWMDAAGIHRFARDSGQLNGAKCKTLAFDQSGHLWVGTEGKGILRIDSTLRWITTQNGLPSNWAQKLLCDKNGFIWMASYSEGLAKIAPDLSQIKLFAWKEGLPDLRINTLCTDRYNRLWVGFQSGHVACIEQDKVVKVFGPAEGLSGVAVRCLAFDALGRLWAGTRESGLFISDGQTFSPAKTPVQLSSQNIYSIVLDRNGHLWVGCENAMNHLIIDEKGAVTGVEILSRNEGFMGIESCHDAALCDSRGHLWFGTMNGLTQRLPFISRLQYSPPALHLDQISLFYKPLETTSYGSIIAPETGLPNGFLLPWNQNHLSFTFSAIDLEHPERIRYRWRLSPAETEWSPWSAQHQISYANLPPGDYRFEVQATTGNDQVAKIPAVLFSIGKPFWQQWPFRIGILALLTLLIGGGVRAYIGNIRRKEAERRAHLEMQNHLLQLEQKARQLQMNPHFIFNALTAIQGLVAQQDTASARREISHFARLMRSILSNSRKNTISLQEEADTLEQYLKVEQFCRENTFTYAISFDDDLDPEETQLPPMLLQPFVENAVVHGVANLTRPGKIAIHFAQKGNILHCTIEDNGIGREAAALRRQERKPGHQPAAVEITRERLKNMPGNDSLNTVAFSDIVDENGKVAGTKVVVSTTFA